MFTLRKKRLQRRLNLLLRSVLRSLKWKRKSSKEELTAKTAEIERKKHEHESHQAQAQAMIWSYISIR